MTPSQRISLPPQAQKQYSERPTVREDILRLKFDMECDEPNMDGELTVDSRTVNEWAAELGRIVDGVDKLTRNLDAAEDTLALIAANGPVGVKMAVAKAQSAKPPPFPICEPLEWKQTGEGEYYLYRIDQDELRRALLSALGFDETYQLQFRMGDFMLPIGVRIAKGDQVDGQERDVTVEVVNHEV